MSKSEFFDMYAPMAMEQQQKYGIPASLTLAQMAIESGYGKGRAITEANNAFCVKGTYNGNYILISDDAPNEKFKKYPSLAESFEDHSRLLKNAHYEKYTNGLSSLDGEAWAKAIHRAGYATSATYSDDLVSIMRSNNLQKYDSMAASGIAVGKPRTIDYIEGRWCMPLAGESFTMSSDYGHRSSPVAGASSNHKGIDISVVNKPVFATEDRGVVTQAGFTSKNGNYIFVEYSRPDGAQYEVQYLHLSKIDVRAGDVVGAGQQLGVSGSTGVGTGPHLHLGVKKDGVNIDPKDYLCELMARSGHTVTMTDRKGRDVLAGHQYALNLGDNLNDEQLRNIQEAQLMGFNGLESYDMKNLLTAYMTGQSLPGLEGQSGGLISQLFQSLMVMAASIMASRVKGYEEPEGVNAPEFQENGYDVMRQRNSGISLERASELANAEFEMAMHRHQQGEEVISQQKIG